MIAPALPINESEVADLVVLHLDRAKEATTRTEANYHKARAEHWSDFYLAHFTARAVPVPSAAPIRRHIQTRAAQRLAGI